MQILLTKFSLVLTKNDDDVGLTCSRVECFGRVTVEYMMSGLCPIVSDSGANLEIVQDRKNGIIYKALNGDALKPAIIWAVNNRKTVNKIGLAAEAYAKKNFSMEIHAKRVKKLYLKALEDNKNEYSYLFDCCAYL